MKYTFRIILIAWTVFMLAVSSIEELRIAPLEMTAADKVMHVIEYAIWSLLFLLMIKQESIIFKVNSALKSVLFFGITLAILDEIHQGFIKGRECDLLDLIADIVGILIVILVYYFINKIRNKNYYKIRKKKYKKIRK